jgi:hypothetical protein
MLLVEDHFKNVTSKNLAYPHKETEVSYGLNSKQEVTCLNDFAIPLRAKEVAPTNDHGFMYNRSFHNLHAFLKMNEKQ